MTEERCTVCDKELSTLSEEGCPQCGLTYDPLMPDNTKPLDFSQEVQTVYIPEEEDDWNGEDYDKPDKSN